MANEGLGLALGLGTGLARGYTAARAEALRTKETRRSERIALAQQMMETNPALAMQILREEKVMGEDVGPETTIMLLKSKRLNDLTKIATNSKLPDSIRVGAGQELAKATGYGKPEEVQTPEQAKAFGDRVTLLQKNMQAVELQEKKHKGTMESVLEQVRGRKEVAQMGAGSREKVAQIGASARIKAAQIGGGQPKTEMDRAVARGDITPEQRKLYAQMKFDPDYAQAESMLKNDMGYKSALMQGNYGEALQRLNAALQVIKQSRGQPATPPPITSGASPQPQPSGEPDYSYLWK